MCQPQSKNWVFGFFLTWSDLRVRIWGLLGQGIGDLDSGLTIIFNSLVQSNELDLPIKGRGGGESWHHQVLGVGVVGVHSGSSIGQGSKMLLHVGIFRISAIFF